MSKCLIPPAGMSGLESMIWLRDAGHVIALNHPDRPGYLWKLPVFEQMSPTALAATWNEYNVTRYAFRPKPNVIVIDIDVNAIEQWRDMQRRFRIQNTRIVRTPSGGLHVYLYVDPSASIRHGTDVLREAGHERCDVFTQNSGLITGPGSYRAESDGKCAGHYRWCTPQEDLAHATAGLIEALKPPEFVQREPSQRAEYRGELHPVCESILNDDLEKLASCSEGNRNKTLYSISANLYAIAAAGEIPMSGLEAMLINASKANGLLTDKKYTGIIGVKKTIESGRKRGLANPRNLGSYRDNYDRKRAEHARSKTKKATGVGSSEKGRDHA